MGTLSFLALPLLLGQQAQELDRWRFHLEEQAIQRIWIDVSKASTPRTVLFEHAGVLRMIAPEIEEDTSLLVENGRIAWIGPAAEAKAPEGALRVDATGMFLMPGLADMHVHHRSSPQALLSIANGVTAERELCGFPWELAQRELIRAGKLLAPDLHVSGHILNSRPMGIFATVVNTPEEAREAVRTQVAEGYDFIKVHNNMPLEVYRAVFAEARRLGVEVVGHVPSGVTLEEAIKIGHHTMEHFKGYILDSSLVLTDEDYVSLTDGSGAWNCPNLSTRVIGLRGEEAFEYLDGFPGMRYVSVYQLERWYAAAETRSPSDSNAVVWKLSQGIFKDLLATDARFLAGSDSGGGYDNQVPGFMLLEELRLMEQLGLPTFATLQAATSHAAEALASSEFGTLEVGKRADLILVRKNPLESVENLREPRGVMLRGVWLPREEIELFLERMESVYSHGGRAPPLAPPSDEVLDTFVSEMTQLHSQGFVFIDQHVAELAELLGARGREADATKVRSMQAVLPRAGGR